MEINLFLINVSILNLKTQEKLLFSRIFRFCSVFRFCRTIARNGLITFFLQYLKFVIKTSGRAPKNGCSHKFHYIHGEMSVPVSLFNKVKTKNY